MRFSVSITAVLILFSGCSEPEESLKHEVEVVKGPLSLQFMASKAVYEYAEPVEIELWLTNDSVDTLMISWPYMSGAMFHVEVLSGADEVVWINDAHESHLPIGFTAPMYPGDSYYGYCRVPDTLSTGRYKAVGNPNCDPELLARIQFRVRPEK
ncbi:hypothetical protein ACFL4Y_00205 [Gemmatimonadota bacterium]